MIRTFVVLVWAVTLFKAPAAWRARADALARTYWLALFSLAAAMTVDQPAIWEWIGRATGWANIAFPIDYGAGAVAGFACQAFLWHAYGGTGAAARVRRRAVLVALLLVVLVVSYRFGAYLRPNSHDAAHWPAQEWGELSARLALAAWSLFALLDIAGRCLAFAAEASGRTLRIGMRLAALGSLLVLLRMVLEYGPYAVIGWRQSGQSAGEHTFVRLLNLGALAGFALMALGLGLPALARKVVAAADWCADLVTYVRLGPLWRVVRPAIDVLPLPAHRVDVRGRLYRRLVEIQDGFFALRPSRDADAEARLVAEAGRRGLTGRSARAWVDAAALAAAVSRHPHPAARAVPDDAGHGELDDRHYLVEVARHVRAGVPAAAGLTPPTRSPSTAGLAEPARPAPPGSGPAR